VTGLVESAPPVSRGAAGSRGAKQVGGNAMFELKPLSQDAIPEALKKAERYRLLNEPREAESICLDVLRVDPGNQDALRGLLLSLTDQFAFDDAARKVDEARKLLPKLPDEYERHYCAGLIAERLAKARMGQGGPRSGFAAFQHMTEAMRWYEKAEAIRPAANDDPILRWNACARIIMSHHLEAAPEEHVEPVLE
jgi:tetratricopeptide (TPR) repeat protein